MARPKLRLPELFSPSGAGIVLICFFLPWVRVSCGGKSATLSGANLGEAYWAVAVLMAIMLATYIYFRVKNSAFKSKVILMVGTALSIMAIIYQTLKFIYYTDIPFYVPSGMIGFRIKPGAWGMMAGLAMLLASAPYIHKPDKATNNKSEPG